MKIKPFEQSDIEALAAAFAEHKTVSVFEDYFKEQQAGERLVWVAYIDFCHAELVSASNEDRSRNEFGMTYAVAGFVTLKWASDYPPFAAAKIPEIKDLNVVPAFRNKGIGNALLDIAEAESSKRSPILGIGVGLYADYGPAQKIYIKRGYKPDGRGVTYDYKPVVPGEACRVDDDLILWMTKAQDMKQSWVS